MLIGAKTLKFTSRFVFRLVGIFDMAENRVFQHLTHQKYAEIYADSESGNGFFLAPVQEWSMSKILLPKNLYFQKMRKIDSPGAPWAHEAPWAHGAPWGGDIVKRCENMWKYTKQYRFY